MSDDLWGRDRPKHEGNDEPWDDLGDPVFADEGDGHDDLPLRFGPDDTGPLPHWTAPPTGEVPRIFAEKDPTDDVDVWSTFAQQAPPVWREGTSTPGAEPTTASSFGLGDAPRLGALDESAIDDDPFFDLGLDAEPAPVIEPEPVKPKAREPIRIGIDPTGDGPTPMRSRTGAPQPPGRGARRDNDDSRGVARPGARPGSPRPSAGAGGIGGTGGRDMPTAVALGLGLAAVFIVLVKFTGSTGVMALVVAVLGLGAIEFYEKTQERGYRPATVTGRRRRRRSSRWPRTGRASAASSSGSSWRPWRPSCR